MGVLETVQKKRKKDSKERNIRRSLENKQNEIFSNNLNKFSPEFITEYLPGTKSFIFNKLCFLC